jgi:uncharacterized membrane protein
MAAGRESQRLRRASRGRGEAEEKASSTGEDAKREVSGSEDSGGEDSSQGFFSELKDVASDAALSVLAPVAKQAATSAAKYAVKKGPELLEGTLMPKLAEAGGPGELLSKLTGSDDDGDGDGGDAGDGTGKGRRMPIQQAVDVAAPIDIVYDQFTQFEDWPKFMHRVERVEQKDDATVTFHEKIWAWRRQWDAEIVEQRPDERIVWESTSGMQHVGVVTFHELSERLTRIELNIDIDPSGPIEKIARGARFAKRAARADLKRFKAFVEMHEDETGAWRGEIQDGEVVSEEDDGYEDEPRDDEPEAEYDDEPEAEADQEAEDDVEDEPDEEPEAEADEPDEEPDDEPEPEPKKQPKKRRQPARSRGSSNGSSKSKAAAPKSRSRSRGSSSNGGKSRSKAKPKAKARS